MSTSISVGDGVVFGQNSIVGTVCSVNENHLGVLTDNGFVNIAHSEVTEHIIPIEMLCD